MEELLYCAACLPLNLGLHMYVWVHAPTYIVIFTGEN